MDERTVLVWDGVLRAFHWSLVIAFFVAYTSGETAGVAGSPHAMAGYVVAALLSLRFIWGFVGGRHARFAEARIAPGAVLAHLRDLTAGRARRDLGHSPAGWAMTFALLGGLTGAVVTGFVVDGEGAGQAPFGDPRLWAAAHAAFATATIVLVPIHLLGVFGAVAAHGSEVLGAMITGRKRAPDDADDANDERAAR